MWKGRVLSRALKISFYENSLHSTWKRVSKQVQIKYLCAGIFYIPDTALEPYSES